MLDSYYLQDLDEEEKAMHEFNKDWKLSGIQRLFYNSLVKQLGGFGSEAGKFIWPTGVTNTLEGDLAIKDTGNQQIQIFSLDGYHKQTFSYGSESTKHLGDVACTQEGLFLVSDGSKGIKVFSKEGEMIHLLKSSKADWKHSYGLSVLKSNRIAVTDWTDGGKIHIVGVDWRMNAILKTNVIDGLQRPEHVAVTEDEDLLVTEGQLFGRNAGCCVKIIDSERALKKTIGPTYGDHYSFMNPSGICVDTSGNFFVADKGKNNVTLFSRDSSLSELVVTQDLEGPSGITVTKNGLLVVTDCYHHCVKMYKYRQEFIY
ncbi:E3 ubiquitin-protein ligase TRIM32-like [Spea bombifrons]|uniref:E3 ubiquitin-protein ligase TRIM32-like n=1 Tax=Spea bombifrons TaxID=233779 RepID=UPI0023493B35|nr:E3 ubiquitin-protein ligase TRIM32-like [Spea bombifrons]